MCIFKQKMTSDGAAGVGVGVGGRELAGIDPDL